MGIKKKNILAPIFFTVFLDLLGIGLIIPVFAPLILKNSSGLFSLETGFSTRTIIYGLLTASFSIAQFFGNPILGTLSDRYGRREMLLYSIIATIIGYVILTTGIYLNSLFLIFAGRIVPGIASGNIAIVYSALADVSDHKTKTKNFGLVGMAFGLGFVIGPFAGGMLSNEHLVSWFNLDTPFIVATLLSVVNLFVAYKFFPETLSVRQKTKVAILTGVINIKKAFSNLKMRNLYLISFITAFGFSFFTQFFIVLLIEKFHYHQEHIGIFFGYLGLWVVISQGLIIRPLSKRMKPEKIVLFSLPLLTITFIVLILPNQAYYLFFIIPFLAFSQSCSFSSLNAFISNLGGASEQGEMLGITLSMNALAQAGPALIGGPVVAANLGYPTMLAALCSFIGWLIFIRVYNNNKTKKQVPIPVIEVE